MPINIQTTQIDDGFREPITLLDIGSSVPTASSVGKGIVSVGNNVYVSNGQNLSKVGTGSHPFNKYTLIAIGDSITFNAWSTNSTTATSKAESWFDIGNSLLNAPFIVLDNKGIGGNTSTQVLARFENDVCLNPLGTPGYALILCGVNDDESINTIANLQGMIALCESYGINVILCTIMPRLFSTFASQARLQNTLKTNRWIRETAAYKPNVYLVDFWSSLLDTSTLANSAQGNPNTTYFTDGLHPNILGAREKMGRIFASALQNQIKPVPITRMNWDGTNGDFKNVVRNSLFVGSGGTATAPVTGTVAANWTVRRLNGTGIACACSKVARTDGLNGEWQRMALSGSTSTNDIIIAEQNISTASMTNVSTGAGYVPGVTKLFYEFEIRVTNIVGSIFIAQCDLQLYDGASALILNVGTNSSGSDIGIAADFQGIFRSRVFTLPANYNFGNVQVQLRTSVGGSCNFDAGFFRIVEFTP